MPRIKLFNTRLRKRRSIKTKPEDNSNNVSADALNSSQPCKKKPKLTKLTKSSQDSILRCELAQNIFHVQSYLSDVKTQTIAIEQAEPLNSACLAIINVFKENSK